MCPPGYPTTTPPKTENGQIVRGRKPPNNPLFPCRLRLWTFRDDRPQSISLTVAHTDDSRGRVVLAARLALILLGPVSGVPAETVTRE